MKPTIKDKTNKSIKDKINKSIKEFGVPKLITNYKTNSGGFQTAVKDRMRMNRVEQGKGSAPRTNLNSKAWLDNYDSIFNKPMDNDKNKDNNQ